MDGWVECGGAHGCTFANFVQKVLSGHLLHSNLGAIVSQTWHLARGVGIRAMKENITSVVEAVNARSLGLARRITVRSFLANFCGDRRRSRNVNIRRENVESFEDCKKKGRKR